MHCKKNNVMSKYLAVYKSDSNNRKVLGEFSKRENAVKSLLEYGDENVSYCLDSYNDRKEALSLRNTCVCGCGPSSLVIEEID